jgi:hypothetical protein
MRTAHRALLAGLVAAAVLGAGPSAQAGKLTVDVAGGEKITLLGAFHRWDQDGNARKKVNPKQKIDAPEVDATAAKGDGGSWVFANLPPGKYDLVILAGPRVRIEGFYYAPVLEFDPFFPSDATVPDEETREYIVDHIRKSPQYENRVVPLYLGGNKEAVRILMMLLRDKPTSYEGDFPGAATLRHEIWQYTFQYGGWVKEKRTRVLDRVMLHRDELRKWTWLWDPKLGGIDVKTSPVRIQYTLPNPADKKLQGLYPY